MIDTVTPPAATAAEESVSPTHLAWESAEDGREARPQDARAARAAARTAREAGAVERLPFDLSALTEEGLFVNVDARGLRPARPAPGLAGDLGVTLPEGSDLAFRPPRCGLLPDRYRLPLLRPAGRAHAALHRYSFRFQLTETLLESPAYRWVPWTAFEAFEAEFRRGPGAAGRRPRTRSWTATRRCGRTVVRDLPRAWPPTRPGAWRPPATPSPAGFEDAVVRGRPRRHARARRPARAASSCATESGSSCWAARCWRSSAGRGEERRAAEAEAAADASSGAGTRPASGWCRRSCGPRRSASAGGPHAEAEEQRREAAVKERLRQLRLEAARERLQETLCPLEEGARQLHAAVYEAATAIRDSLQKHRPCTAPRRGRPATWPAGSALMNWQSDAGARGAAGRAGGPGRAPAGASGKRDPRPDRRGARGHHRARCYADARALAEPHRMGALEL